MPFHFSSPSGNPQVGCLTFLLARKHTPSATCRQKLAALPSCWTGNTPPQLPADRSWLPYLPVGQETYLLSYLQAEVGCLTFLLARKHIPSATCRQKLAVLPSCWPGKHIPSATYRQKLAVLPSRWPGNTSSVLPADRSWLSYLPVGQETHPLHYLQTEVGCLTFLLDRKHIASATCRQKLAALPSCWQGKHTPSATCRQKLAVLPSCWQGNTQLLADRRWLPYLPVEQETHPLHYLQTEVGCLTVLLARKHPLCYLQTEVGCLTFLLDRKHPLSYLQTEVGCLTFLLARKRIPSATCRQKFASFVLDSCPSSHEGRRMLKSSPTNQLIFNKKAFRLKGKRRLANRCFLGLQEDKFEQGPTWGDPSVNVGWEPDHMTCGWPMVWLVWDACRNPCEPTDRQT